MGGKQTEPVTFVFFCYSVIKLSSNHVIESFLVHVHIDESIYGSDSATIKCGYFVNQIVS